MIVAERFSSYEPRPTAPQGRQCRAKGCETVLSVYNDGALCSHHEEEARRVLTTENFGTQSWALGSVAGAISRKALPESSESAA